MSAHAGIVYTDTRPVGHDTCEALAAWNRERGPHASGSFVSDGVALLQWSLHVDRLAVIESQPRVLPDRSVLTWDGRLDNRDDLLLLLDRHLGVEGRDVGDAALAGAALMQWGESALRRLMGDWSLAWWRPESRTLLLARDLMGNRPLHYAVRPDGIAYSTCLETLVAMFELYDRLDHTYLASYLAFSMAPYRTPYADVLPVPAGHYVTSRSGQPGPPVSFRAFNVNTTRYQDESDYAVQLRALFTQAVRTRLRARGPVWAELSGGLDSSTVVGVADALVRRGQVDTPAIRPVSRVFKHSPEADESDFIASMEAFCGLSSTRIEGGDAETLESYRHSLRPYNRELAYTTIAPRIVASGGHVLLTGALGDGTMAEDGSCASQVEHLHRGDIRAFIVGCATWARRRRLPAIGVIKDALSVYAPLSFREQALHRSFVTAVGRAHRSGTGTSAALALTPIAVEAAQSARRPPPEWIHHLPFTKRLYALGIWYWTASDNLTTSDCLPGVLVSHPYADVPLVDFVLSVPDIVRWKPHRSRALMRAALGSFLPPMIAERETKGVASATIVRSFRPLAVALGQETERPRLVQLGLVEPKAWATLLLRLQDGSLSNPTHIKKLLEVEAWLRGRRLVSGRHSGGSIAGAA
jgi:asparagine synthase (glutamine-hydrolysing)